MNKFRGIKRSNQFGGVLLVIGAAFVIWLITRLSPHKAGVSLKIAVDCDNVGEIWCDFSLGGKELGTMSAGVRENDVRALFKRGEVVSMNIPPAAFDNETSLHEEKFEFALYVLEASGESRPVRCDGAEFFASLGGKYSYTLTCADGEYYCS